MKKKIVMILTVMSICVAVCNSTSSTQVTPTTPAEGKEFIQMFGII